MRFVKDPMKRQFSIVFTFSLDGHRPAFARNWLYLRLAFGWFSLVLIRDSADLLLVRGVNEKLDRIEHREKVKESFRRDI